MSDAMKLRPIRMPDPLYKRLEAQARREDRKTAELARILIRDGLTARAKK